MKGPQRTIALRRPALLLAALLLLVLVIAPRAKAFVYWTSNRDNPGTIGRANLDGTGVKETFITDTANGLGPSAVDGLAVDGAHVYWVSGFFSGTIGRANVDGSGVNTSFITPVADFPRGVAVDGAHVYWGNALDSTIGRARLNGTHVNQSFIPDVSANDVAVDGAHVYWTTRPGAIGRARLDGTGVRREFIDVFLPDGVAVDGTHIYWTEGSFEYEPPPTIGRANLDGTHINRSFIPDVSAYDVAVDGAHLYWADLGIDAIARAKLDGTGVDQSFISVPGLLGPSNVAVDSGESFSLGKVKKNRRRGTAKLTVNVPGPGKLKLAKTKKVRADGKAPERGGKRKLLVKPRRNAKRKLATSGKARVRAKVTFTSTGGKKDSGSKKLMLVKR